VEAPQQERGVRLSDLTGFDVPQSVERKGIKENEQKL
jgi:hypothetical protein